tara:strand:- start:7109 stop:8116 length:1008 start_codon:yes stop_codon:yes gene_type:complete
VKIIFWGTPKYAVQSLNIIFESEHTILAVITQPDKKRGRGNTLYSSPVKTRALELGIKVFSPTNIKNDINILSQLQELNPDIYIVVAFGQILPEAILEQPIYGSWNAHASLLPKWRGAAPIQRSILNGDSKTGVTIMYMEKGLDTGPILLKEEVPIKKSDNYNSIADKLSNLSSKLILKSIPIIKTGGKKTKEERLKNLSVKDQSLSGIETSYAATISKEELKIDWNFESIKIHRQVMAFHPNAFTHWKNKRLKVLDTEILDLDDLNSNSNQKEMNNYHTYKNGTILSIKKNLAIVVKTLDFPIMIKIAQLEGKKVVQGNSLIQQLKPQIGELFI